MKREAGFTLIEGMIALIVISIGLLALGSFTISVLRADANARARILATHIAEQMLEEWAATSDLATYGLSAPSAGSSVTGTYTPADINVTYTLTAEASSMIAPIPDGAGSVNNQALTGTPTPIEKKVTIAWDNGGVTYSIYLTHATVKQ